MGGEFFTDFKSSNGIEISWLVQVLSNFYWFWGSTPWGGGRWVHGVGVGMGVWGVSHAHTHAHTRTCMHTRTHMHVKHANMLNMDTSMSAAICNFYTCIHVCMCVCVRVRVGGGHPPCPQMPLTPPHPPAPSPEPQGAQNSKIQCPELIEIIRFCLKILYLWTFLNSYRL